MRTLTLALLLVSASLTSPMNRLASAQDRGSDSGAELVGSDREWEPGARLEKRVQTEIAGRWGIEPDRIHLEWGTTRGRALPTDDAEFTFNGDGKGGNWIVTFSPEAVGNPPLRVWLRAGVEVLEPVAAKDLERGYTLEATDIVTSPVIRWGIARENQITELVGWVTRRQIRSGEPLREPAIGPPLAIRSGERIEAVWRRSGVALTLQAQALGTAVIGERVQIRTDTGLRLEATARARGVVEIDAPPEVR